MKQLVLLILVVGLIEAEPRMGKRLKNSWMKSLKSRSLSMSLEGFCLLECVVIDACLFEAGNETSAKGRFVGWNW